MFAFDVPTSEKLPRVPVPILAKAPGALALKEFEGFEN